jgi:hypothetical protein
MTDAPPGAPVRRSVRTPHTDAEEANAMPKYVIERELPGAGSLTHEELRNISKKSNEVLAGMDSRAHWLQSYVTDDKIYCVYRADNEDAVREHATCGGFPANAISRVSEIIDPSTGE